MECLWNFWALLCENGSKSSCIASYLHYNNVSCILDVCLLCWNDCVLVGLDWVEPMMFLLLHITCLCIFMHTYLTFSIFLYIDCDWFFSTCVSLSFSLILSVSCSMAPKWKSTPSRNSLRFGSSYPTPSHVRFYDDKARQDLLENFSRQGIHLEHQVILSDFFDTDLPTVIHSKVWESLYDVPVTCPSVLIQELYSNMHGFDYSIPFFVTRVRSTCILVTLDIVSDVLHVPRVAHPNFPSYDHLKTMSKDELISSFCELPSDWGDRQFTPCTTFAKGPRFINMVITFVLYSFSHYNSITEPHARFLLSL